MTGFVDNIPGDGRDRPAGRPRPQPGTDDLGHLNIAVGTRIRVIEDLDRKGLKGLEGEVVQTLAGAVVVELDNDPALYFRSQLSGGIAGPSGKPRRHFLVTAVERV